LECLKATIETGWTLQAVVEADSLLAPGRIGPLGPP